MKNSLSQYLTWLEMRTPRERVMVFLAGCAILYFIWYLLLDRTITHQIRVLKEEVASVQDQLASVQQQIDIILKAASNPDYQKLLAQKSVPLPGDVQGHFSKKAAPEEIRKLIQDLLNKQKTIQIVDLNRLPDTVWAPKGLERLTTKKIYKQGLQMLFHANYFSTLAYINHVESLGWNLYLESLDYKVQHYPEADVLTTFYVLSEQTS